MNFSSEFTATIIEYGIFKAQVRFYRFRFDMFTINRMTTMSWFTIKR